MDELITHIQEEILWCMLYAYDIMLMDESRERECETWGMAWGFRIQALWSKLYKDGIYEFQL